MDRHLFTHKKEEKLDHGCPFCLSSFSDVSALNDHIKRNIGEKPYSCSVYVFNLCYYTRSLTVDACRITSSTSGTHKAGA